MSPQTPKQVILAVVVILGIVTIGCVGGIIWLASVHTPIPSTLEVIAGTALGGVTGLLVSTKANPEPVAEPIPGPPSPPGPAGVAGPPA